MRTESLPARTEPDRQLRGLLHDLGHGLATVSYLADGLRGDPELPGAVRRRLDLMDRELARLLDLVSAGGVPAAPEPVDVRELLGQVAAARNRPGSPALTVRPGRAVTLRTDPTALWRMVSNLVDNAARAAGPDGVVELAVTRLALGDGSRGEVTVEVTDDGPGFGHGPAGTASLGLGIVTGLARMSGASLRWERALPKGTRARLVFQEA